METASRPRIRLVVLASGNGSNLQAVIDASHADDFPADVVAVVSDRAESIALSRAAGAGAEAIHLGRADGEPRTDYDHRLADEVERHSPDLVVLAGWMRILTSRFLSRFPDRVINLHPALPGDLPGTNAIERAWQQAMAGERTRTGVMVHYVPDEGVDDGPVIAVEDIPIRPDDDLAGFEQRVHEVEHRLLVDTIRSLCSQLSPDLTPGAT
jgi:phosphoribosylglycinamide formyltransferase-1